MECRICYNQEKNISYKFREMFYGKREEFNYFLCSNCGCIQIEKFLKSLREYYPHDYYAFKKNPEEERKDLSFKNRFKYIFSVARYKYLFFNNSVLGKIGSLVNKNFDHKLESIHFLKPKIDTKILDVGCGNGELLYCLKEIGFISLLGIDPFIKDTIKYSNQLIILKKEVGELPVNNLYDLIMMHHVLEHIPKQLEILQTLRELLNDDGIVLIRIPIADSYAWEHYKENWVQLDAPRHYFIHSMKSIKKLVEQAGFKIKNFYYDSTEFQFWGSEQYIKNIPLFDQYSFIVNPKNSIFSVQDIEDFSQKAASLNKENKGDQVVLYLSKD
jgi:2-polyprenyl-3-methyl-5-hydroxy-6-metoxy-1,4-benzoquinol methylase